LARDLIIRELTAAGATVNAPVAYASAPPAHAAAMAQTALANGLDLLTFTAASTVRNFAELLDATDLVSARSVPVAVIGPQTALVARELGFTIAVEPQEATLEAMLAAIIDYFHGLPPQPAPSPQTPAAQEF
jgi:uroporphyrinogen III methyltransferase/synthase